MPPASTATKRGTRRLSEVAKHLAVPTDITATGWPDVRTTCLPKYMERSAYLLTFWKLGKYYRTYPAYVEDEVTAALTSPTQFERGPRTTTRRGTRDDDTATFVVEYGRYVSARWPGDAYRFARAFLARL